MTKLKSRKKSTKEEEIFPQLFAQFCVGYISNFPCIGTPRYYLLSIGSIKGLLERSQNFSSLQNGLRLLWDL